MIYGLSLTQPWATLMAVGAKHNETRSWGPDKDRLGSWVAIQAAKKFPPEDRAWCNDPRSPACRVLGEQISGIPGELPSEPVSEFLVLGQIVALAYLRDRYRIHGFLPPWYPAEDSDEYAFGNYQVGRWVWHFDPVIGLEVPIPIRGQPQLWMLRPDEAASVLSQINPQDLPHDVPRPTLD